MTSALLEKNARRVKRRRRIRAKASGTAARPRLSVFRSNKGVVAQLVDDEQGRTLVAAQWFEPEVRDLAALERAKRVGALLAQRAAEAGIETCVFDRGGYQYHGRVKALAEGAREGGLRF